MRVKTMNIRFNLDDNIYYKAYENLKTMDKKRYKSMCRVVAVAVNEFFDRQRKLDRDPYFETRQRENEFCETIVKAVGEALEKAMPVFMATYLMQHAGVPSDLASVKQEKPEPMLKKSDDIEDLIDLDFVT